MSGIVLGMGHTVMNDTEHLCLHEAQSGGQETAFNDQ